MRLSDLPSPPGLPFVGNLLQLDANSMHTTLERWERELGKTYTFRIGRQRMLASSDPEIAHAVLRDRPEAFRRVSDFQSIARELGLDGLFTAEGERWRSQRKLVMQALASHQLQVFFPTLILITSRLRRRWLEAAEAGAETDVLQDLTRFTVDVTSALVFGHDINTLESGSDSIQQHIGNIFQMLSSRLLAPFPYWRYVKLPKDRALDRSIAAVEAFARGLIGEARVRMREDPSEKPRNLLEAMLAFRDESGSDFTDEDVSANVLTLLLAGEDTTAYTLAWTLFHLAANPDIQAEMRESTQGVLGMKPFPETLSDLAKLDEVEYVALEAMRLKPVAPLLGLEANRDLRIGDIDVPSGTNIYLLTRPAMLEPSNFANPQSFRPYRWRDAHEGEGRNARAFIPFGAGPRFCPGRNLAMLEIKVVLAMLAQSFSVSFTRDPARTREVFAVTMMPSELRVRFVSREGWRAS